MCGIAGVVTRPGEAPPSGESLRRMASVLRHRGPDDEGVCLENGVGLAHRRLSIIDLSGGHQPIASEDGSLIIFNGEIYNFLEIRRELEDRGRPFRTRSDTEVLLRAYEEWGVESLQRLNGMFAFAIWDAPRQRLFAARDRMGKKPFFYCHRDGRLVFGSEIKAILAFGDIDREIDHGALEEYLRVSYISSPRTIFRHVRKLPPAHFLLYERGRVTIQRYWELVFRVADGAAGEEHYLEGLESHFREAVARRLISDVPLGALLSGGIDSSAVVGMMSALADRAVRTFSIGFDVPEYSELADARIVARHFRTDHHELIVRPSAVAILPDLVWHLDEPFGDSSAVPTYYVSKLAAEHVKVVLTGDGGDEVFAGYTRYGEGMKRHLGSLVPGWIRKGIVAPLAAGLPLWMPGRNRLYALGHHSALTPGYGLGPYPYIADRIATPELRALSRRSDPAETIAPTREQLRSLDRLSRLQLVDTIGYLPNDILTKVDRTSMAHGLEVRSPLLDYRLVEFAATIPSGLKLKDGRSKHIFKRLCERFLPPEVLQKPKQGFGIPKGIWFRTELRERAREHLLDPRALARGYFRPKVLRQILDLHDSGQRDYSDWLWNLLVLEEWHRVYVDRESRRV